MLFGDRFKFITHNNNDPSLLKKKWNRQNYIWYFFAVICHNDNILVVIIRKFMKSINAVKAESSLIISLYLTVCAYTKGAHLLGDPQLADRRKIQMIKLGKEPVDPISFVSQVNCAHMMIAQRK